MNPSTIPKVPGGIPLIGHLRQLIRDPLTFLTTLPAYGDLVEIRLGPYPAIVVCDPELTRQVLRDDRTFDKGGPVFERLRQVTGDNVGTCPHSSHRRQRRLLQPAFHHNRFPDYARTISAGVAEVTDSWRAGQVVDVYADMMRLTLGVLLRTMFSSALTSQAQRQAIDDFTTILAGLYRRTLTPPVLDWLPTPGNRRYDRARERLRRTVGAVITHYRTNGEDHHDLLSALLAVQETADEGVPGRIRSLTDTEIRDQLIIFLVAGTETTASTVAWALHLLAHHPDVEQRLHAEVNEVLDGGTTSLEHLPRLRLTSRVITETLRLYPPGWMLTRAAAIDTRLGGRAIPAGTTVIYSPYLIHRRGDLYDQPERFDPDRWLPERSRTDPRDAYIPFGGGARKCIGDRFGVMEATITVASIAARWRLSPVPGQRVRPWMGLTLRPRELRMLPTPCPTREMPHSRIQRL